MIVVSDCRVGPGAIDLVVIDDKVHIHRVSGLQEVCLAQLGPEDVREWQGVLQECQQVLGGDRRVR